MKLQVLSVSTTGKSALVGQPSTGDVKSLAQGNAGFVGLNNPKVKGDIVELPDTATIVMELKPQFISGQKTGATIEVPVWKW